MSTLKSSLKRIAALAGLEVRRVTVNAPSAHYVEAAEIIKAADDAGLSVRDYTAKLWGRESKRTDVLSKMEQAGALADTETVVEIGPGTGGYLDELLLRVTPSRHEIYEIAVDWRNWLATTYGVVAHDADGSSLRQTPAQTVGLIHAHGVFVYISFLDSVRYFREMARVTKPAGFIVFDFFSEASMDQTSLDAWIASKDNYPKLLPRSFVIDQFERMECIVREEFSMPFGHGNSTYLAIQKL